MSNTRQIMTGSPFDTPPASEQKNVVQPPAPPPVRVGAPAPLSVGTGPTMNQLLTKPVPTQNGMNKADILLTDPNKFAESVVNDVVSAVNANESAKKQLDQMWTDFYSEHPDLSEYKDEVQSVLKGRTQEWWNTPLTEVKTLLATETRTYLDRLKRKMGVRDERLSNAPAITLPSSNEPAGTAPKAPERVTSFVDEMKEFNRKKRKV